MENEIIYEEELVTEEVYRKSYAPEEYVRLMAADEKRTRRQRRRRVFNEMKKAGIIAEVESEYSYDYESIEDHIDIVVKRTYKKQVPYKVTKEEIYKGEYIMDGDNLSPEEQRENIFKLLKDLGYDIENESEYEIEFEASENKDSKILNYTVKRVSKEKVEDEDMLKSTDIADEETTREQLTALVALKEQVMKSTPDSIEEVAQQVEDKLDNVDEMIETQIKDYGIYQQEIEEIKNKIKVVEERITTKESEYQEIYEQFKQLMEKKKSISEEEQVELANELLKLDDKLLSIRKEQERSKKELITLRGKLTKINNKFEMAKLCGLSAEEYDKLESVLAKKGILNAILEKKGLEEIINTPSRKRTKAQKREYAEAKKQIMKEISELQLDNPENSILDNIQALYGLNLKMVKTKGRDRILIMKPETYALMVANYNNLPKKISMQKSNEPVDYTPQETPDDLKDVMFKIEPDTTPLITGPVLEENKEELQEARKRLVKELKEIADTKEEEKIESKEVSNSTVERITIYKDKNTGKYYARPVIFERFYINPPTNDSYRIDGALFKELNEEDYNKIVANKNNELSPYEVADSIIDNIEKVKEVVEEPEENKEDEEITGEELDRAFDIIENANNSTKEEIEWAKNIIDIADEITRPDGAKDFSMEHDGSTHAPASILGAPTEGNSIFQEQTPNTELIDKITIFKDKETGKVYARSAIFERFRINPLTNDIYKINNGGLFREIKESDLDTIIGNQNNDLSPYMVDVRQLDTIEQQNVVEKATEPKTEPKGREAGGDDPTPRATEPKGKDPQPKPTEPKGKDPQPKPTEPKGKEPTGKDPQPRPTEPKGKDPKPTEPKQKPTTPKTEPKGKDPKDNHVRPHVEEILLKLTEDLDIHAKDAKRFTASNIKVAKGFTEELQSGNYLYNIVHFVPSVIKLPINLIRKLVGKITLSQRAKEAMETLKERLDELSEEELDVLFDEYKGSQLKTDMNNQINPIILDKMRSHGLAKVEKLNEEIKANYSSLFIIMGQLKAIEEKLNTKITPKEREALEKKRKDLYNKGAKNAKTIIESRKKADSILSSGVHGLEEDYKAVATKMSYVGMRFGKSNDFDHELQDKLGNYGRNLNIAIANDNDEAIVQNFMGLESCYYDNTEIRGSIVGKRSVGTKYYSPLAEQFDYRDDPFIRDLFTTVAVTTAAVSAINALRTREVIAAHNKQIEEANAMNEATVKQARDAGTEIAGKRGTFQDGMSANAEQDILTNAGVRERSHLDQTNWQFNDAYHTVDHAGHEAYNQFGDQVSSQINTITGDYARGAITAQEALSRMANVSTNAHSTLRGVVDECLPILRDYAKTHPQFDLHAVEQSMQYIVSHPDAVANMNQAMVDVTNIGESLTTLQAVPVEALGAIPLSMSTAIISAATSAALAGAVSSQMSKKPLRKNKYGNEVTDMMDEYMQGQQDEEEKARTK